MTKPERYKPQIKPADKTSNRMRDSATTQLRPRRLRSVSVPAKLKSYLPGAEKGRVPPAWMPLLVASAILNGCFSATCALAMIDDRTTGVLVSAITLTSINYWRDPRPGFRHLMDVLAITANMSWHYYLVASSNSKRKIK